jgi:hypothetical protein
MAFERAISKLSQCAVRGCSIVLCWHQQGTRWTVGLSHMSNSRFVAPGVARQSVSVKADGAARLCAMNLFLHPIGCEEPVAVTCTPCYAYPLASSTPRGRRRMYCSSIVVSPARRPGPRGSGTTIVLLGLHPNPASEKTKSWSKSLVPSSREAQRLADQVMEPVNERNSQPHLFQSDEETSQAVYHKCRELTWPHLKNSTRKQYEENFKAYLLPEFGNR